MGEGEEFCMRFQKGMVGCWLIGLPARGHGCSLSFVTTGWGRYHLVTVGQNEWWLIFTPAKVAKLDVLECNVMKVIR